MVWEPCRRRNDANSQTFRTFAKITPTDSSVSEEMADNIVQCFVSEVPRIFEDNLAFGSVCGSVARGVIKSDDDIDTVIVVKEIDNDQVERFNKWIFDLHDKFSMKIDQDFPYELFTIETMEKKFGSLDKIRPSLHYVSSATYDTMTWAEMVCNSSKAGIIGDEELIKSQGNRCSDHVQRWRREIIKDLKVRFMKTEMSKNVNYKPVSGWIFRTMDA